MQSAWHHPTACALQMFERESNREKNLEKNAKEAKAKARKEAAKTGEQLDRVTDDDLRQVSIPPKVWRFTSQ